MIIRGYASVFNVVDQGNDVILPEAFATALSRGPYPLLDAHEDCCGVIDRLMTDDFGLMVSGEIFKEYPTYKLLTRRIETGALKGMSIGYRAVELNYEGEPRRRHIKRLDLLEVSLVTFPMNKLATIRSWEYAHRKRRKN